MATGHLGESGDHALPRVVEESQNVTGAAAIPPLRMVVPIARDLPRNSRSATQMYFVKVSDDNYDNGQPYRCTL